MTVHLTDHQVASVKKLWIGGNSQRKIALLLDLSRKIIGDVLRDKRKARIYVAESKRLLNRGVRPPNKQQNAERCFDCGATVHLPCLACQIRRLKERDRK